MALTRYACVYFSPRTASKSCGLSGPSISGSPALTCSFLHVDVHAADDGVFLLRPAVFALDVNLAQAFADFAVLHDAVDFTDDGGVARLAGLKEFDDARQVSGDVLGLGGFARDFCQH